MNWVTINGTHIDLDDPNNPVTGSGSWSAFKKESSKRKVSPKANAVINDINKENSKLAEATRSGLTRSELRAKTKANKEYLKTDEYNNKFDVFPESNRVSIRSNMKSIINKNTGTTNESFAFIDNAGNVVHQGDNGSYGADDISTKEIHGMKGLTLIHNHSESTTFSVDDVNFFSKSSAN